MASWTWANHGVDLEGDRILWWDAVSPVSFAGGGASTQSFSDFLAHGASLERVPDDILRAVRMSIGERMNLRAATAEDGLAIASIRANSWRETYAHLLSPAFLAAQDPASDTAGWARTAENVAADPSRGTFVVAELDATVRGFAIAGASQEAHAPRELELWLLYQDADLHGTGSGQRLLDAAIGDGPAFLWTAEGNPRAQAFYRKNGFEADGERMTSPDWDDLVSMRMVR